MGSYVVLTRTEVYKLRLLCANPILDFGSTMRSEHSACLEKRSGSKNAKIVICFPTTESVDKWQSLHENRNRTSGHGAIVALTVALGGLGGSVGAVGARTRSAESAPTKEELQVRVGYPTVRRGWTLTRDYAFRYKRFPGKSLTMIWSDVFNDDQGIERDRASHGPIALKVGGELGVPENLVGKLISELPAYARVNFR